MIYRRIEILSLCFVILCAFLILLFYICPRQNQHVFCFFDMRHDRVLPNYCRMTKKPKIPTIDFGKLLFVIHMSHLLVTLKINCTPCVCSSIWYSQFFVLLYLILIFKFTKKFKLNISHFNLTAYPGKGEAYSNCQWLDYTYQYLTKRKNSKYVHMWILKRNIWCTYFDVQLHVSYRIHIWVLYFIINFEFLF